MNRGDAKKATVINSEESRTVAFALFYFY